MADSGGGQFAGPRDLSRGDQFELRKARLTRQPTVLLSFDPYWLFRDSPDDRLLVTVPLLQDSRFIGALQAAFPLDEVRQRLRNGRNVVLWYAVLYGGVLFLFGLFQLTRNVIRPVIRLTATTRAVAGGDLDPPPPAGGPREIAELGQAFNEMIRALKESRRETSLQIAALEDANRELQRTRDDLVRSAKLASVGHLAAGMAHEIGNPLGAALGYLELLKESIPPRQRELAERTLTELGRIDGLVKDLLDYAAPGRDRPEPLDATEVAREALQLLTQQGALDGIAGEGRTARQTSPGHPDPAQAAAGVRQPSHQCPGRHHFPGRDPSSRRRRRQGGRGCRGGRRQRDRSRSPPAYFRSFRDHQGSGEGAGAWSFRLSPDRRGRRRPDDGPLGTGPGQHLLSASEKDGGGRWPLR